MCSHLSKYLPSFFFCIAALFSFSAARGQALSLDSCKAMAFSNQAKMKNAQLEILAAKETRKAAITKYFPTVSLAAGWFHSQDYLIDVESSDLENSDNARLDVDASFDGQSIDSRSNRLQRQLDRWGVDIDLEQELQQFVDRFSVDARLQMLDHGIFANALLTQPLYAGGRIVNGNRLAKLGVDVAELQFIMTRDEVELNVEESYWLILSLQEKLRTVDRLSLMLDTLQSNAAVAQSAGLLGQNDLLKVQLKRNELDASRTQLVNGIQMAGLALCQLVGMPYSPDLSLSDTLASLPPELSLQPLSAGDLDRAVSNTMEGQLLDASVRAEQLQRAMILGEALPQAVVGATYGVNNFFGSIGDNAILFATVNVPLSSWWESSHSLKRQDFKLQQALNNQDDLRQKIGLLLRQLRNEEMESFQLLSIRRQALNLAQQNLQESSQYYEAGLIPLSDYLEAQTLLQQAHSEYVDQQVAARLAHLRCLQHFTPRALPDRQ